MPSRRTFVSALQASTLCVSAALRHPGCACSHSPLEGTGSPSLSFGPFRLMRQFPIVKPPDAEESVGGHAQKPGMFATHGRCPVGQVSIL